MAWFIIKFLKINIKTINKVQAVNILMEYHEINILPPSMMIEGDE
jgi:hypothetical protein